MFVAEYDKIRKAKFKILFSVLYSFTYLLV